MGTLARLLLIPSKEPLKIGFAFGMISTIDVLQRNRGTKISGLERLLEIPPRMHPTSKLDSHAAESREHAVVNRGGIGADVANASL